MGMEPILRMIGVTKVFPGTVALNSVTMDFYRGEVHAIMGENGAGKSTLINVLTGSLTLDGGSIEIGGKQVKFAEPRDAQNHGIVVVHQELSLFTQMSVMENISSHKVPSKFGLVNKQRMASMSQDCLKVFETKFALSARVKTLSVSEQQIVEVARAISQDAEIYIFDEPTATLSSRDVESLFVLLKELRSRGKTIIYVSHKFDEIFSISDRISVLRDGNLVGSAPVDELNPHSVIRLMVGRDIDNFYPDKAKEISEEKIMEVSHLEAGEKCRDVSFDLYKGEILGIFGLVGSGRTEIARALSAIDHREKGSVMLKGKRLNQFSVRDSIRNGLYYLTEDRKSQGLFLRMSIMSNSVANRLPSVSRNGFVRGKMIHTVSQMVISDFNVKCASPRQLVGRLSGGNQQKLMIGSWVKREPQVVIMDEPTRGIDVGAKAEIHALLRQLASEGVGTIMISSELPEVIGVSDRVLIVFAGKIVTALTGKDINEETIMKFASGLQ